MHTKPNRETTLNPQRSEVNPAGCLKMEKLAFQANIRYQLKARNLP